MYEILLKQDLVPNIHLFKIAAPDIANKVQPGQFVVIMVDEKGERIPLTVADWDKEEGSVTLIFAEVGTTTRKLAQLKTGDSITHFVGPLGLPSHIGKFGTVVCVSGCYGIGSLMPIARAMREAGNRVISFIEARSTNLLFWEEQVHNASDQLIIATGDASYGSEGRIVEQLKAIVDREGKVDLVMASGCTYMMMLCAETTRPLSIKTIVHLAPIMVDGTGMCGCCRVSVGDDTKFACVDGPEFDGHQVDWNLVLARQGAYLDEEIRSLQVWECQNLVKSR